MLDDNLRVLGRRINDLELELEDKKEKMAQAESEKFAINVPIGASSRTARAYMRTTSPIRG